MLELNAPTRADFEPQVGQPFELITGTGGITLTLQAVEPRTERTAAQPSGEVTLVFQGAPELRLPAGVYPVQNVALGKMELRLSQRESSAQGSTLEAVWA